MSTVQPFSHGGIDLVPVQLSTHDIELFYEGFSNATLWPLYHDVIAPPEFHRTWWDSYRKVNRRFADAVIHHASHGATVWVQDYQLQLVPKMLREARPDLKIGFFNHIPFPPPEIFAQLPWRRAIIDGLLGADLVGLPAQQRRRQLHALRPPVPRRQRQAAAGPRQGQRRRDHPHRPRPGLPHLHRRPADQRTGPEARNHRARHARSARTSATPRPSCSASTGSTTPRASGTGSRPTRNSWRTARSRWRTPP